MEFTVLGPIEVRADGQPLALGGTKPRALLAILLLAHNQVVSRDRLIDGLWGDGPPASAGHSLDHYVSRLRLVLGEDRVERRAPGYVLRVAPDELDLDRFERLRRQGHAQLADDEPASAAATLSSALALWAGAALADVLYEPFAAVEAERLEDRRLLALEDRMDAQLALGHSFELVPELEGLAAEHPFRERLLGQLMLALYRSGRQTEGLEVYRAARRRLAGELGLEPGPALRELERAILTHEVAPQAVRRPAPVLPRGRRRAVGMVASLAILVTAGVVAIAARRPAPSHARLTHGNHVVALGMSGQFQRDVALAATPTAVAAAGASLWVAEPGQNAVLRIDASSGSVADRVALKSQPGEIVVDGGAVWVASTLGGSVTRIDRETDEITQTVSLGGASVTAIAVGGRGLWVADATDRSLVEINRVTGVVGRRISLGFAPTALAIGRRSMWVADYDGGAVAQIDLASGQTIARVNVGEGPVALAIGDGAVWTANSLDGTVSKIDPATSAVTATVAVGSGPEDVEVSDGSVWVAAAYSGAVARLDAGTGALVQTVRAGGRPTALAATARSVWASVGAVGHTHRGGTLRLVTVNRFPSVDPALYEEDLPTQFTGLAYDTLVTFARAAGPAGLRLVPDLALAVPSPSDGGTTYAFRLRPGLRYSDGRPVRPGDFRRAFERLFGVRSPGVEHYSDVLGARACGRRPRHCDLSRGIVTDDATGSVVFHLVTPDPDFLYELTSFAFSAPIPPGTPDPERGSVVPGTGPYRISTATANEVRFVRNPSFHEWSHAAQPDGEPDTVDWRVLRSREAVVHAIEQGTADWTFDLIPPSKLREVETHAPAQVHENPWFLLGFAPLNTTAPPFDDVRVRRALNYAIDRSKVVRMYGGTDVATPTCQPLAPGIPGYVRSCPYTRHPRRGGRWTAPDLTRARRLVAASGKRGALINVWGATDELAIPKELPAYVAEVLRTLGFRTRLHLVPLASLTPAVRRHHQISVDGDWLPDYPAPSSYFPQFFACGGTHSNGYFCDPRLDRQMAHARALELRDPRGAAMLWTRVDHELVDRAAWLPLVNPRGVDLVSRRLKNFTFHPVWGFIADQAWLR